MNTKTINVATTLISFCLLVNVTAGDFEQLFKTAKEKLREKDYAGVRELCDKGMSSKDLTSNQKFSLLDYKAIAYEREKKYQESRLERQKIIAAPDSTPKWKYRMESAIARTLARYEKNHEKAIQTLKHALALPDLSFRWKSDIYRGIAGNYSSLGDSDQSLAWLEKAWKLPDLSVIDRCIIAGTALKCGHQETAMKWMTETLASPDLKTNDKVRVLNVIADIHAKAGEANKLRGTIEQILAFDSIPSDALMQLGRMNPKETTLENTVFAFENYLKRKKIHLRNRRLACAGLIEALAKLKKFEKAREVAANAANEQATPASFRFQYAVIKAAFDAIIDEKPLSDQMIDQAAKELEISPLEKLNGLHAAGKTLMPTRQYDVIHEIVSKANTLLKKKEKRYVCKYVENAPLGAGGWFLSDLVKDEAMRANDFLDYNQKDADQLILDVSAERGFDADKAKNKAYYFDHTAFHIVYDSDGWHIFVVCGEKEEEAEKAKYDGGRSSTLEMYFAPGPERAYQQWIIKQGTGELSNYDWNSHHRHFRSVRNCMKTETDVRDSVWGTYIFFPWEAFYDQLPFDTGEEWIFDCIRWSPAGGLSWSGGGVHETGKWGTIEFQKPTEDQLLKIKKHLVRKAWTKYKKSRDEAIWRWRDSHLGDRAFYDEYLEPEITRLDHYGEMMKNPANLGGDHVKKLFNEAVPDWMEFSYLVSEKRSAYLRDKLFSHNPNEMTEMEGI